MRIEAIPPHPYQALVEIPEMVYLVRLGCNAISVVVETRLRMQLVFQLFKGIQRFVLGAFTFCANDDHPDTVLDRLKVYHEQTEPLKGYYENKGILRIVEGQEEVADTTALTLQALED